MKQSVRIIQQCIARVPDSGSVAIEDPRVVLPQSGWRCGRRSEQAGGAFAYGGCERDVWRYQNPIKASTPEALSS
jgi:hypothetical protein